MPRHPGVSSSDEEQGVLASSFRGVLTCSSADNSDLDSTSDSDGDCPELAQVCGQEPQILLPPCETNRDVVPEKWALTISQWHVFLANCMARRNAWRELVEDTGYATCYGLNDFYVRPWTRRNGASVALRMNAGYPLQAALMVSHGWGEDINECGRALSRFCTDAKENDDTIAIWFCLFALYQPGEMHSDPGPTIQEQLARDPFGSVIRCVKEQDGMIVVHTSKAEIYNRLWCVYEIAESLRCGSMTQPVCSEEYFFGSRGKLRDVLRVQTQNASCSNKEDKELICKHVRKAGGFQTLDKLIFKFRLDMLQRLYNERNDSGNMGSIDLGEELHAAAKQILAETRAKRLRAYGSLVLSVIIVVGISWCIWASSPSSAGAPAWPSTTTAVPMPSTTTQILMPGFLVVAPPNTTARPNGTAAADDGAMHIHSSKHPWLKIALSIVILVAIAAVVFAFWRAFSAWRESFDLEARLADAKMIIQSPDGS